MGQARNDKFRRTKDLPKENADKMTGKASEVFGNFRCLFYNCNDWRIQPS